MIDYALDCRERVGIFFVCKKDGRRLRLIVGARRSNQWFHEPDYIPLATGSSLGEVEIGPHEQLYVGHGDLCDAFYYLGLPIELRPLFRP